MSESSCEIVRWGQSWGFRTPDISGLVSTVMMLFSVLWPGAAVMSKPCGQKLLAVTYVTVLNSRLPAHLVVFLLYGEFEIMKHFMPALLIVLFLTACATPYAKQNAFLNNNLGYNDMALGKDTFLVTFRAGTGYDTSEDVFMKLFYRAAEIAKKNGVQYFRVKDFHANNSINMSVLPGWSTRQTSGTINYNHYMGQGTVNVRSNNVYVPPQIIQTPIIEMRTIIELSRSPSKTGKDTLIDTSFILENWEVH